jgi:hypothetical protein
LVADAAIVIDHGRGLLAVLLAFLLVHLLRFLDGDIG